MNFPHLFTTVTLDLALLSQWKVITNLTLRLVGQRSFIGVVRWSFFAWLHWRRAGCFQRFGSTYLFILQIYWILRERSKRKISPERDFLWINDYGPSYSMSISHVDLLIARPESTWWVEVFRIYSWLQVRGKEAVQFCRYRTVLRQIDWQREVARDPTYQTQLLLSSIRHSLVAINGLAILCWQEGILYLKASGFGPHSIRIVMQT